MLAFGTAAEIVSYYPRKFAKLQRIHLPNVSNILKGTFVLVLR